MGSVILVFSFDVASKVSLEQFQFNPRNSQVRVEQDKRYRGAMSKIYILHLYTSHPPTLHGAPRSNRDS